MKPPFRVEHVGSFIRPPRLLEAARARKAGSLKEEQFKEIQDQAIREIVAFQESLGLPSITDGEFRRRSWSAGFIDAVEGFGLRDGTLTFRDQSRVIGVASSPYAKARLRRRRRIVADDYRFLKSVAKRGVPKVTIAAPDVMHYFLGPQAFEREVYADRELYFEDLKNLYREEIADLAAEGCTYLQLDDTALPCNCDPNARQDVAARGEDADELTERYVRLINECISARPSRQRCLSGCIFAVGICGARGWPRAATSPSPRRSSTASRWTSIAWSTTPRARATSRRCASCRRASA